MYKDFRLLRTNWLVLLVILTAVGCTLVYHAAHSSRAAMEGLGIVAFFLAVHLFYLPATVWASLNKEWKRSAAVWLQVPVSGWTLLASKLAVATLFTTISYGLMCTFAYWILTIGLAHPTAALSAVHLRAPLLALFPRYALYGLATVLSLGLYIGVWITMISVALQAVKNRWGRFSGIVAVVVLFIPLKGIPWLLHAGFLESVAHLGRVRRTMPIAIDGNLPGSFHFYLGQAVLGAMIFGIVLYLAGWAMDRKVEV